MRSGSGAAIFSQDVDPSSRTPIRHLDRGAFRDEKAVLSMPRTDAFLGKLRTIFSAQDDRQLDTSLAKNCARSDAAMVIK